MEETSIALNASEMTIPCSAALVRQTDPSLIPLHTPRIFDLVGATSEDRWIFTSSGAEAVNQVLWSVFLEVSRREGKCHFITSAIEDLPTMQMMQRLEQLGCFVKIAPVNERGEIDVDKLAMLITPRTALISVTMAQGLTGVIQPVEEIAKWAKEKGVLLHLEASYAVGKYAFSLAELGADYLTFSGELIHATVGSGGLFARREAPLVPLIVGGSPWRAGPLDTAGLLSLCAAAQQSSWFLDAMSLEVARLRDLFEQEIVRCIPEATPLFHKSLRLPHITVFSFPRVHQEALHYLLQKRVKGSIGHRSTQPLKTLLAASKISHPECAMSFALSRMTTQEEVHQSVQSIAEAVKTLRSISRGVFDAVE